MPSVLVFTRTRRSAHRLARAIAADGFAVGELHSDLSQPRRNRAMEAFRRGEHQVLVATNLAARGLDVEHITHVISLDVPNVPDDYVHRIGRTARAGAEGDAFILVSPAEERLLAAIERQTGQRLPRVTLPDFNYAAAPTDRDGKASRARGPKRKGGQSPAGHRKGPGGAKVRPAGRPTSPQGRKRRHP